MTSLLVRVKGPNFCAAFVMVDDVVTETAPILKWAMGKRRDELRAYFARKGWETTVMKDPAP